MFKLGLTGSIATGKTTALEQFAELGYPVFSADQVVHNLYEGPAASALKQEFPEAVSANKVDRAILATYLTKHPEKIEILEAIIHPMVLETYLQFLKNNQTKNALAVIDIPLLFEGQNNYHLDAVAVTHCEPDLQRQRAMAREGMTVEKFRIILDRQMDQQQKKQKADYLIDTNGTLLQTKQQVVEIAKQCLARAKK